jgi:hypothetical protein
MSVVSLGVGGSIVLEFTDNEIVDGPGADFIVFENAFFCAAEPQSADDPYSVFAEPGFVAVSDDGVNFATFPYDAAALAQVTLFCSERPLIESLGGLMGISPSPNGNYTVPNDPLVFDPGSPGGVSGHGGDAFDLAAVGLSHARFVRITDSSLGIGIPGASEGVDLDSVVAINSRPLAGSGAVDSDDDGLSDEEETLLFGSDPLDPDSDDDGRTDGEEVASCRDPMSADITPFFLPRLDLEIAEPSPTVVRWNYLGPGGAYDVVRGDTDALRSIGGMVDLGVVSCIENDSSDLTTSGYADPDLPPSGEAFFYLVRGDPATGGPGYGSSSAHESRQAASGDCP